MREPPIVDDFRRWVDAHLDTFLPQDEITKALNYTNNHWEALTRFLTDGRIPIDNNWAERAVKAIALGRNAYMFCGSDATRRSELGGLLPMSWKRDREQRAAA